MKKIYLAFTIAVLGLAVGCSNEGAFSEEEKKQQDSVDAARQPDGFEALEKQQRIDDSIARASAPKPDAKGAIKPGDLPGADGKDPNYVPPSPHNDVPKNGELPPGPPIQQPKK